MGQDGSEIADSGNILFRILLVMLVVGLVITAVVAIILKVRASSTKLNSTMDAASTTQYQQYDNATVLGSDVISFLKLTKGQSNIAVFISNSKTGGTYVKTPTSQKAYNYNCLADGAAGNTVYTVSYGTCGTYTALGSVFYVNGLAYDSTTGSNKLFTNYSNVTTMSVSEEYVSTNAQFNAQYVYDSTSGEFIGIIFRQL